MATMSRASFFEIKNQGGMSISNRLKPKKLFVRRRIIMTIEQLLEEKFETIKPKLGKYAIMKKEYLEESNFDKYQAIMAQEDFEQYFMDIDKKADEAYFKYEEELKNKYKNENKDSFEATVKYEAEIKSKIEELINKELIEN